MAVGLLEFPIPGPNGNSTWITSGPDGNLYFTQNSANQIGQFNPTTHASFTFPIPTPNSDPTSITAGSDGNLYFTETTLNQIGQFNPIIHTFATFPIPTANSGTANITSGPDGNLYFTESSANQIGQFNPVTHAFASFQIPTPGSGAAMIISGPGGNLWFLETSAQNIAQFNPTTHVFATYSIPTANSGATFLTTGADGNLYFTAPNANQIVGFNPSTHIFGEFVIPLPESGAGSITPGSDGNLYFMETNANQIGQFNPVTHVFASLPIPTANSGAAHITTGPGFNLYFTESTANMIGEVITSSATAIQLTATPNPATVGQVVTLVATVNTKHAGTSRGTVAFSIDGTVRANVGITLNNGLGQATFQVSQLSAGAHTMVATFKGNSTLVASTSKPVRLAVNPAPDDGPVIVELSRYGVRSQHTIVILTFDKFLNQTTAENLANYQITGPRGKAIPISSVDYNLAAGTVTIFPARRLNIQRAYRLTVVGTGPSGVTDTDGRLLDGAYTGQPGSNYVTILNAASLARR